MNICHNITYYHKKQVVYCRTRVANVTTQAGVVKSGVCVCVCACVRACVRV